MTEGPVEPVEDKNPPADEVELVQADAGSDIEAALTDEVAHAEPEESDEPRAEDADPVEPEAEEPVLEELEVEQAAAAATGADAERLQQALSHLDRCFIGTIHSFCARLLRARPIEAGVDLAFEEMDEAQGSLAGFAATDASANDARAGIIHDG